ncbi:MAG: hypothetical protein QOE86_1977 [Solirubrobacteraceae bacterium]|nr:hypothetical protein [Solirubrobacteraceae bacterium]
MAMSSAATVTSLDAFHATPAAQRRNALVRTFLDAVNAHDPARIDALLARSFLSLHMFRVSDDRLVEHWETVDWVRHRPRTPRHFTTPRVVELIPSERRQRGER